MCSCYGWMICPVCILLTSVAIGIIFGLLIAWKPKRAIEMQIAYYKRINWKMEPISMEREVRNTRIAGVLLIIFSIFAVIMVKVFYIGLGF